MKNIASHSQKFPAPTWKPDSRPQIAAIRKTAFARRLNDGCPCILATAISYSSCPTMCKISGSPAPSWFSKTSNLFRASRFVPMSLYFQAVGTWPTETSCCNTNVWIHFRLRWRIRPTPCRDTNICAAELSVHCWWVTMLQLRNSKQRRMKIASEHPDTMLCNSLSALDLTNRRFRNEISVPSFFSSWWPTLNFEVIAGKNVSTQNFELPVKSKSSTWIMKQLWTPSAAQRAKQGCSMLHSHLRVSDT